MNSLLDNLNVWADHALRFAWPMLWQSSLLIGVLFALDLGLRKKVRPAVRYALWLIVVVKVLLPPSLAFPTGPSWWLRPAKADGQSGRASVLASPDFQAAEIDQGSRGRSPSQQGGFANAPDEAALPSAVTPVVVVPPRLRLSPAGWAFVGMVTVSLGLFAWMLVRWYQVARDARRAAAALAWLGELLPERQRPALIRLTDRPQSPAVCGLFRPVILLPRSLADHLPPAQLRAVLLHELVHLRRGDVWVNCLQALVQILYWWHPLLWLANARIRRVREEAVDDAVMLALNEEAETYASTLLEVAKLSLRRPLASLGLVGILESRSSLRQRIERLLDFRPPRRAGLTLGSALAVLGFAALAVPMGEGPATNQLPQVPESQVVTNASASNDSSSPGLRLDRNLKISRLVHDGKILYEMGRWSEAEVRLKEALKQDPQNQAAAYYLKLLSQDRVGRLVDDGKLFYEQGWLEAAEVYLEEALKEDPRDSRATYYLKLVREAQHKTTGGLRKVLPIPNPYSRTNLVNTGPGRQTIISRLDRIWIERVSFDGLPLGEVVRFLNDESKKRDPEERGINFLINQNTGGGGASSTTSPALGPDGNPLPAAPQEQVDMSSIPIKINPALTNIWLAEVLDAIVMVAEWPIKYTIEDYAIVFSPKGRETTPLYVRTFKVDPNTMVLGLHPVEGPAEAKANGLNIGPVRSASDVVNRALRDTFARAGVDLDPTKNPGRALFYNDRQGILMVRGTMQDLDIVEREIAALVGRLGEPPAPRAEPQSAASQEVTSGSASNGLSSPSALLEQNVKASTLVHDGKLLYEMGKLDEADAKLKVAVRKDPQNEAALYYLNLVSEAKFARAAKLHGELSIPNPQARTNLVYTDQARQALIAKLQNIRLDSVRYDGLPLGEVMINLNDEAKKRDPEKRGINFLLRSATNETAVMYSLPITIKPALTDVRLADVLDVIVKVAGRPIHYSIADYAVVFSAGTGPDLYLRIFKVDRNVLIEGLHLVKGAAESTSPEAIARAFRDWLSRAGVDLDLTKNPNKAVFYSERQGALVIRATSQDLDIIEAMIQVLNIVQQQINIKCKFVELSEDDIKAVGFDSWGKVLGNAGVNGPGTGSAILTEPQVKMAIRVLEQRQGAQLLADMGVTVSNGRQAQCKATDRTNILTGINSRALNPPGILSTNDDESSVYAIEQLDLGPILDVTPSVMEDGYTINMRVIATVLEFSGYAGYRTNRVAVYVNGKLKWVSPPSPDLRQRQMVATACVRDGQTLVLSNPELMVGNTSPVVAEQPGDGGKRLIVLVTPTIIDPAGNRVHAADETPLPRGRPPPQEAR